MTTLFAVATARVFGANTKTLPVVGRSVMLTLSSETVAPVSTCAPTPIILMRSPLAGGDVRTGPIPKKPLAPGPNVSMVPPVTVIEPPFQSAPAERVWSVRNNGDTRWP